MNAAAVATSGAHPLSRAGAATRTATSGALPLSRAGAATRTATSKPRLQEGTPMEYRRRRGCRGEPLGGQNRNVGRSPSGPARFPSRGRDGGAMTPGGLGGCARIQPCASMIEASQSLWMPTIVF